MFIRKFGSLNYMKLQIEKLVYGGSGLGHDESGRAVFVKKVTPQDNLEVEIEIQKKTYAEGTIKKIIKPGPERVLAPCPHFDWCGGCDYQCLSYENQLKIKEEIFAETLKRQGITIKPEPILKTPQTHLGPRSIGAFTPEEGLRYRNNNRFFFIQTDKGIEFGRHNFLTQKPAPVGECLLQSDKLNLILGTLRDFLNSHFAPSRNRKSTESGRNPPANNGT
jgi:23S rRNA (uracil1939-C5)-methyltransferase